MRIAMTVAERGSHDGRLVEITGESGLDSDAPLLVESERSGRINPDLKLGADVGSVVPLKANEGLSSRGMMLFGSGFIVSSKEASHLGLGIRKGLEAHIRPYLNGRDLQQRSREALAIDFYGLSEVEVRKCYPEAYQHILEKVKPVRDINRDKDLRERWWQFGRPRSEIRPALANLSRYIATVETSKHRIFQYLGAETLPDNKIIIFCLDDPFFIGVMMSSIHATWAIELGGWIGFGNDPVYVKTKCFDPFPFPDATPAQRAAIADLAEELDATRKAALAEVPGLTMTEIYNLVAWLRTQKPSPLQGRGLGEGVMKDRATAARAGIILRLHDQIDAAVATAYGWPTDLAPSEIVARLVALNAQRASEEKAGTIRWLRPDYQIPRFAPAP